jgi:D-amino-acid oxidase
VPSSQVTILGAGVVGLTTAITLAQRGVRARVLFDPSRVGQSSWVAPALFTPYAGTEPARFARWTRGAFAKLKAIANESPESGVRMGELREYCYQRSHYQTWMTELLAMRELAPPAPCASANTSVRPHVDMLRYMPWLEAQARGLGVEFVARVVGSLSEAAGPEDRAVINCSGVGARRLVPDPLVKPMHGQLVHCPNDLGLTHSVHDDAPGGLVTYVFTFADRLVLGGTFEAGRDDAQTDGPALEAIVDRCRELLRLDGFPRWADLAKTRSRVIAGVRPTRGLGSEYEHTRVELDRLPDGRPLIHNYGHGRAGVTLSWATAADAADLTLEAIA